MATAVKRRSRYTNYSRVPYDAYDGSAARQLQREEVLRPRPMVRPQNGQVVYVDLSEPDTVTFFNQDEAVAGLDGMFESVKSIASEIVAYFQ